MLLSYFGQKIFYSGVQAELKAQYSDQGFVNRVCQTDQAKKTIIDIYPYKSMIPLPKKMRYFYVVCEILSKRLELKDVSQEDLLICANLLQDRYFKVASSPAMLGCIPNQTAKWHKDLVEFKSTLES